MFTLPNTGPWPAITDNPSQDGRGLIGMNVRSTYNYFLKRFAQGDLNMQDHQVRQKSARFLDQTETWCDTNLTNEGEIAYVQDSSVSSNQGFVYYGNSDVLAMKNPMPLSFSSKHAYGTASGTALWNLISGTGSGPVFAAPFPPGTLEFSKVGSGSGPNAGTVTWSSDHVFAPGSGFLEKVGDDGMIHSRNNIPQSGWIVGFVIMEGGNNTTFVMSQNGSPVTSAIGTVKFDILGGTISSPVVIASDILSRTMLPPQTRTQRTMFPFRDAIRYDNITDGLGVRMKVSVFDPTNPTLTNKIGIVGHPLLAELLVIEDVKL